MKHTGEKTYQCSQCDGKLSIQNTLKIHLKTHTDESPYQCSHCDKTFSTHGRFIIHMRSHTGGKAIPMYPF